MNRSGPRKTAYPLLAESSKSVGWFNLHAAESAKTTSRVVQERQQSRDKKKYNLQLM